MKKTVLAFVVLVLAAISCDPMAPQSFPTQVPGAVETIIVLTANAANAMTQAVMATATETPPGTPTPTETPLPATSTPTATPTFFYSLPTPTNTLKIVFTPGGGGGGGGDGDGGPTGGTCDVTRQTPPNGSQVKASKRFTVTWVVKNTSSFKWGKNDYDLIFFSGDPLYTQKIYDLPHDVAAGESVSLTARLDAPATPGVYSSTWKIRGDGLNCYFEVSFKVIR
ncbi:MAG: NBR1-Ig-like domain-containing protein [Chloroflexota bacterium]